MYKDALDEMNICCRMWKNKCHGCQRINRKWSMDLASLKLVAKLLLF